MTNPINSTVTVGEVQDLVDTQSQKARETRDATQITEKSGSDQVTLTADARKLGQLIDAAASEPDIDTAKVQSLRNAISRGEYRVDSGRIAERMVDFEKLLQS